MFYYTVLILNFSISSWVGSASPLSPSSIVMYSCCVSSKHIASISALPKVLSFAVYSKQISWIYIYIYIIAVLSSLSLSLFLSLSAVEVTIVPPATYPYYNSFERRRHIRQIKSTVDYDNNMTDEDIDDDDRGSWSCCLLLVLLVIIVVIVLIVHVPNLVFGLWSLLWRNNRNDWDDNDLIIFHCDTSHLLLLSESFHSNQAGDTPPHHCWCWRRNSCFQYLIPLISIKYDDDDDDDNDDLATQYSR